MSANLPEPEGGGEPVTSDPSDEWALAAQRAAAAGQRHDFDPERVPLYPMLRATIRQTDAGDLEGSVDDEVVARDTELGPVRTAILTAAAATASKRMGPVKAIRVRGTAPDGAVFHLVVDALGAVHEVAAPGEAAPAGKAKTSTGGGRQKQKISPLFVAIMAVPLLMVATPLVLLASSLMGDEAPKAAPAPPSPTQLPVVAPAPYSPVAAWSITLGTTDMASSSAAQITADPERVYAVRGDGTTVSAYDATTGVDRWSTEDVLDDAATVGPTLASVEGQEVLVLASTAQLTLLDPETGTKEGEWDLPETNEGVQVTATGPLVLTDATHAQVVHGGDLVTRVVPATGVPVAPGSDGSLVVVGARGEIWISESDTLAGDPRRVRAPRDMAFDSVAGWTGDRLVMAYRAKQDSGENTVQLVAVDTATWAKQWTSEWVTGVYESATATGTTTQTPMRVAPAGEWGIYGSTALDLATGTTTALPDDWQTTAIADEQAFGTGTGRPLVATVAGVTKKSAAAPQPPSTSALVAPQAAAGASAFVVSTGGNKDVLFALRVDDEQGSED